MWDIARTMGQKAIFPAALALLLVSSLAMVGCETRQETRGYRFDEERLAQIKVGTSSQDEVLEILGSPSSLSTFSERNNTWYYIASNSEAFAFFREEIKDQKVVAIDFDENGRVAELRRYGLEDGVQVKPVGRETPTRGKELGVFEQFFGNLGRFNRGSLPGAPGSPGLP
ncbi:MAG: outer membrane protein assembly factor BamE [Alphaproteobacteria bacterium]|nr:outer membrane protein assembly factor BamE [Alphaproteobacteria bacterium]